MYKRQTDIFGPIGLLLLWLFGNGKSSSAPVAKAPGAQIPPGAPAPWPQALPAGLPVFPGPGWEYDEPPPQAVQDRARQLLAQLWARGKGASKTEQVNGRWITFRAEIVRSGKQGVVAYRLRIAGAAPKPGAPRPPGTASAPAPAPAPAAAVPITVNVPAAAPAPGQVPIPVPGGTIYTSPVAFRTLRRGMGQAPEPPLDDVRLVQQKLGVTPANGRFGPLTEAAVRKYQLQKGLKPDGIVGPLTWTSLFAVRA